MNVKEWVAVAVGAVTLIGTAYGLASTGGWILSRADAQAIAQQTVEEEAIARERGYLELQRELKFNRLRLLNAEPVRTPDEELELSILRDDIKRITDRLVELDQ